MYRVDMYRANESQSSAWPLAITENDGSDATIMKVIDIGELKRTPRLPYEVIVSSGTVHMVHGKFRIALDFPDLTMSTFMKISGAPSVIEEKMKVLAKGK